MNKIINIFKFIAEEIRRKKEDVIPPLSRGIITFTKISKFKGVEDDLNKVIKLIEGNKIVAEYPYDEILVEHLERNERIPIDDLTQPSEFLTKEEIEPGNIIFTK